MRYKVRDNKDQLAFSFRKKDWKRNSLVLLLMFGAFFLSGRAAYKVYKNREESQTAALEKQRELAELQTRYQFLKEEIARLDTPEGRESEFRKKFGVGRPGEQVAIIVESAATTTTDSDTGFWQSIKNFFKKD
jgi:cell division protein FtsB